VSTPYIYYRIESGPVFDFLNDLKERKSAAGDRLAEWAKSHGAKSFVPGFGRSVGGGWAINSLVFEEEPDTAIWRRRKYRTTDGYDQWVPRQNSKTGKALVAEMRDMDGLPSDDEFCSTFGFPHAICYHGNDVRMGSSMLAYCSITTARIGWTSPEVFWVVLPDYAKVRAEYEAKGYTVETPPWSPPEGMVPLTRAHYELAQAQAEVDAMLSARSNDPAPVEGVSHG
jgi:hypothetical protein